MDEAAWKRLERIHTLAKQDEEWRRLNSVYREERLAFLRTAHEDKISEFILNYVNTIADMAYRELLLACENMRFPEELEKTKDAEE